MATTPAPNHRASLLAGLRTGGVRSSSMTMPHTASPAGSFNVPRVASHNVAAHYPIEDDDELTDLYDHNPNVYSRNANGRQYQPPMTAAVDSSYDGFQQRQQQEFMHQAALQRTANMSGNAQFGGNDMQAQTVAAQALQMQMMQIEIMRLQAMQQAQGTQYGSMPRRASQGFVPPATAGPLNTSFDLRSSAQHRTQQADQFQTQQMNGSAEEQQVPMTAAIGGKFASRTLNPNATVFRLGGEAGSDYPRYASGTPLTANFTTVISGGTPLGVAGNGPPSTPNAVPSTTPSKSDAAVSWRRGGNNNSVLRPNVKVTPPSGERVSPPLGASTLKSRPQPLQLNSQPVPTIAVDSVGDTAAEDDSSTNSNSSPTTPNSVGSGHAPPLSPREEASKRLYEGLGIGRPIPVPGAQPIVRVTTQPVRQPRGPPSNTDELGPKNFASRIRRQAIGGLGALIDARKRSEILEVI